jgi:uncharacterized phage-associated protein
MKNKIGMINMGKDDIERDILKNSFYMIKLFIDSKEKCDINIDDEPVKIEKDENGNINEESLDKYIKINRCIITNLKLQKIMYFLEAYYMVIESTETNLFDSEWCAWDYGPVSKKLYEYYRKYGSLEITLSEEEISIANNLPENNKKYIEKVYKIFGGLNAYDLVSLTHMKGSPWEKIKNEKKYDFQVLNDSVIDKKATKEWFESNFNVVYDGEKEIK